MIDALDEREHFRGDAGFLVGKAAALADWHFRREKRDFAKLCQRLLSRRHYLRHRTAILAAMRLDRIARATFSSRIVYACAHCGAEFCRLPTAGGQRSGPKPQFCSSSCYQSNYYAQRTADARSAVRTIVCRGCLCEFTASRRPGPVPVYCTRACGQRDRDAKRRPSVHAKHGGS